MNENDQVSDLVQFIKVRAKNKTILNVTICKIVNSKTKNIILI